LTPFIITFMLPLLDLTIPKLSHWSEMFRNGLEATIP
jgi:hypothetical protein